MKWYTGMSYTSKETIRKQWVRRVGTNFGSERVREGEKRKRHAGIKIRES